MYTPPDKTLIDTCNTQDALDQLNGFEPSLLWQIMLEDLKLANEKQIEDMGSDPNMPNKELHFRRGTIFANASIINMLSSIRMKLENKIALANAEKQINETKPKGNRK